MERAQVFFELYEDGLAELDGGWWWGGGDEDYAGEVGGWGVGAWVLGRRVWEVDLEVH